MNQQCSRRFFDAYVGVENICKCVSTCVVVKAVTPSWKHNLARSKTHLSPFWISLRPIIAHVTIFIILSVKQDGPSFSISLLSYAVLSRDNPLETYRRGARFFKKKEKGKTTTRYFLIARYYKQCSWVLAQMSRWNSFLSMWFTLVVPFSSPLLTYWIITFYIKFVLRERGTF